MNDDEFSHVDIDPISIQLSSAADGLKQTGDAPSLAATIGRANRRRWAALGGTGCVALIAAVGLFNMRSDDKDPFVVTIDETAVATSATSTSVSTSLGRATTTPTTEVSETTTTPSIVETTIPSTTLPGSETTIPPSVSTDPPSIAEPPTSAQTIDPPTTFALSTTIIPDITLPPSTSPVPTTIGLSCSPSEPACWMSAYEPDAGPNLDTAFSGGVTYAVPVGAGSGQISIDVTASDPDSPITAGSCSSPAVRITGLNVPTARRFAIDGTELTGPETACAMYACVVTGVNPPPPAIAGTVRYQLSIDSEPGTYEVSVAASYGDLCSPYQQQATRTYQVVVPPA